MRQESLEGTFIEISSHFKESIAALDVSGVPV